MIKLYKTEGYMDSFEHHPIYTDEAQYSDDLIESWIANGLDTKQTAGYFITERELRDIALKWWHMAMQEGSAVRVLGKKYQTFEDHYKNRDENFEPIDLDMDGL